MLYVFLLIVAVLGIGLYLLFFLQNVPGAVEERLGVLEPLPADLGVWKAVDTPGVPGAGGTRPEIREERLFLDEARGKLLHQVRFRNPDTGEIMRVEKDRAVKRRRIKCG